MKTKIFRKIKFPSLGGIRGGLSFLLSPFSILLIAAAITFAGCEKENTEPPAAPTGLMVSDTTATGAMLSWTSEASAFVVEINGKTYQVASKSCEVTGLAPATGYTWQVCARAGEAVSDWASSAFTTKAATGGDDPVADAWTWAIPGTPGSYTLIVSGKGAMDNYTCDSGVPWSEYVSGIKAVVIEDGITTIGHRAFQGCFGLTTVTFGNSVATFALDAFFDCASLTTINVDAANPNFSAEDGVLFNKDKTTLIKCFPTKAGSYDIPNTVTTIGGEAFALCFALTEVTIPNSVTTIERGGVFSPCTNFFGRDIPLGAFALCTALTEVTIPNSVTAIDDYIFLGCSNLTEITIGSSVTTISTSVFQNCDFLGFLGSISNLTTIHVDAGNPNYSSEDGVLFNKDKTTLIFCPIGKTGSYVIPNTVITIDYSAFQYCPNLTEITIGSSVTTISTYIFQGCYNLTTINVDAGNPNYSSEDGVLFNKDKTTLIFCLRSKTGSYVIPNTVITIGEQAFWSCYNLTEITLGSSVTTIVGSCYYFMIPNPDGTFTEELICDEGAAFAGWYNLTAINVDAGNLYFSVEEGVLFNKDKTTLIFCLRGKTGSYVIPNTVTTIGEQAFGGCYGLTEVTIGNLVTTIGSGAFLGCDNLTTVTNLNPTPQDVEYIYHYDNVYVSIGAPAFLGVDACTLRVPVGSAAAYKAAAIWKDFGTIVEIE